MVGGYIRGGAFIRDNTGVGMKAKKFSKVGFWRKCEVCGNQKLTAASFCLSSIDRWNINQNAS